jgi:hypothetical protein
MISKKRKTIEKSGWKVGTVETFLNLNSEESDLLK